MEAEEIRTNLKRLIALWKQEKKGKREEEEMKEEGRKMYTKKISEVIGL